MPSNLVGILGVAAMLAWPLLWILAILVRHGWRRARHPACVVLLVLLGSSLIVLLAINNVFPRPFSRLMLMSIPLIQFVAGEWTRREFLKAREAVIEPGE